MKIRKLLFATEFASMALPELKALCSLKETGLEEVVLLHVVEIKRVGFVPYGGFLKDVEEKMEAEALSRFREWAREVEGEGIRVKPLIKRGVPWRSILLTAQEEGVHMIALGTDKDDPDALDVGSTVLNIIRHAELPVIIAKRVGELDVSPFHRPLLAIDFSLPSEKALGLVMGLAPILERVDLVYVMDDREIRDLDAQEIEQKAEGYRKNLQVYVQELAQLGVEAQAHVFVGNVAQEILRGIQDFQSTLVVMGTTGKDRFKEFWLGSASHRVAEMAPVSVLLVP